MCKQLVVFVQFLVVLVVATGGQGSELAHRWSFNGDLTDSVGGQDAVIVDLGDNDAILSDTEVTLTGGDKGSSDYIDLPDYILSSLGDTATFEAWATQISVQNWSRIFDFGASTSENVFMSWTNGTDANTDRVEWVGSASATVNSSNAPYELGTEYHVVCVFEPGLVTWYTAPAGDEDLGAAKDSFEISNRLSELDDINSWLGRSQWEDSTANASFNECRLWVGALTETEREKLHDQGPDGLRGGIAQDPTPEDEATDVLRDLVVSWKAGEFAATHDVYLGTSWDDVNDAGRDNPMDLLVSQGQVGTTCDLGRLEFGQTYYWRVDEVNAAPDDTIFKGEVWSFSVEPFAYPIEDVVITTNAANEVGMTVESMIDGSGLEGDMHSTNMQAMWVGVLVDDAVFVQYDFDAVYKLHQVQFWNYNSIFESMLGLGCKEVTVEYTENGTDWVLFDELEFARAPGTMAISPSTVLDFGGVPVQGVKLTINSSWGGSTKYGISEIRFLQLPAQARNPEPASGATEVDVDTMLGWRAGREAASHEVYLGADEQAVIDGTVSPATVVDSSYNATLDLSQTYYWKVVEVNEAEAISAWDSQVWNFTTTDFIVVDDFESYNDEDNLIYETWEDGWVNDTGSMVGYLDAPFAEQTIVLSGEQSMPLSYGNVGGFSTSEADLIFDAPQDWSRAGVATLVVNFHGALDNAAAEVYVKINDTKVTYDRSATGLAAPVWKQWNIDLASVGVNLQSVSQLTIGIEGSGEGIVYVDDIRLYRFAPAVVEAVDPGTEGLALHYAMENNLTDDSGNGNDGTPVGEPFYDDAVADLGRAMSFDGINDHVELPIGSLISSSTDMTVAFWVDFANSGDSWQRIFDFGTSSSDGYMFLSPSTSTSGPVRFAITPSTGSNESIIEADSPVPTGWHHVAVTIDSASMMVAVYVDGLAVAEGETTTLPTDLGVTTQNWLGRSQYADDAYFTGLLADFSIYTRALSAGEVRYLAGDR